MSRELRYTKVVDFTSDVGHAEAFKEASEYIKNHPDYTLISTNTDYFVDGSKYSYELFLTFDGVEFGG